METTIKYSEEKNKGNIKNLIPVHINIMRCDNYFWKWKKENQDWIREKEIPENLKRAYKSPLIKSNY